MSAQIRAALTAAGLKFWKGSIHPHPEATGFVAVLTSPGYDPVRKTGRMVTGRGANEAAALGQAVAAVSDGPVRPTAPEDGLSLATPEDGFNVVRR